MDNKTTMFIGSSSEGLNTARAIKEQFDNEMDVTLWNEGVFELNASSLESLLRASNYYEFAILVFTPDDLVKSRNQTQSAPRDNVLFEHGLFLGRLGPNRAFIVCEETTKILSDYAGITITTYRNRDDGNLVAAVGAACNRIRSAIKREIEKPRFSLLPSTALAIGYYENFIKKVMGALKGKNPKLQMKRKRTDTSGQEIEELCPLPNNSFTLHVVIPDNLAQITPGRLDDSIKDLDFAHIVIDTQFRDFPFYIRSTQDNPDPKTTLSLFDIPTTLLTSRETIKKILGGDSVGLQPEQRMMERREILNFQRTLRQLIDVDYGEDYPYLKIVTMKELMSV